MKKYLTLLLLLFFCSINQTNAQDICKSRITSEQPGFALSLSTTPEHFIKIGITLGLVEFMCYPYFDSPSTLAYTVNQQADLMYFEEYFDTTHVNINYQGYYRLTYIDSETGYCWVKDLVWNFYDINGVLQKKEYYNKGELIENPAMPQPTGVK